ADGRSCGTASTGNWFAPASNRSAASPRKKNRPDAPHARPSPKYVPTSAWNPGRNWSSIRRLPKSTSVVGLPRVAATPGVVAGPVVTSGGTCTPWVAQYRNSAEPHTSGPHGLPHPAAAGDGHGSASAFAGSFVTIGFVVQSDPGGSTSNFSPSFVSDGVMTGATSTPPAGTTGEPGPGGSGVA